MGVRERDRDTERKIHTKGWRKKGGTETWYVCGGGWYC